MSVPVWLFMPSREKPNRTFAFCKPVITHATRHDGGITVAEPRRAHAGAALRGTVLEQFEASARVCSRAPGHSAGLARVPARITAC